MPSDFCLFQLYLLEIFSLNAFVFWLLIYHNSVELKKLTMSLCSSPFRKTSGSKEEKKSNGWLFLKSRHYFQMEESHANLPGWSTKKKKSFVCCVSNASLDPAEDLSKGKYALITPCLVIKWFFSPGVVELNSSSSQEDLQQDALAKK